MSAEENKALVRRWIEEMNKGNLDIFDEICTADYVYHNAFPPPEEVRGLEEYKQAMADYLTAFPDGKITIEDQIAEGDKVVTRVTFSGSHKGEIAGIAPTEKKVTLKVISIVCIIEGKAVEEWENFDTYGFMQQIGAVPPLEEG